MTMDLIITYMEMELTALEGELRDARTAEVTAKRYVQRMEAEVRAKRKALEQAREFPPHGGPDGP